ncbi:Agamous-like MADS-box protein AGL62 [Hordeum vulgare]|nr:Agamous-like MADS-box protein AGL62 [Hordeum vulgare]
MPRTEIRLDICRIKDDKKRSVTFSKRHANLFKSASNLSALTGVRVAIIVENDSGKTYAFGTPAVQPIVDSFLSGNPLSEPLGDEATKGRIKLLQRKVARLDMDNAMLERRANLSLEHIKNIQVQNPGIAANNIFSKQENLSLEDLQGLFNDLMRVKEDIRRRLPPLQHGDEPNTGGPNMQKTQLLPSGPLGDHLKILQVPLQPSSSQYLTPQVTPRVQVTSESQHTMEPLFPSEMFQYLSSPSALESTPLLQLVPCQVSKMFHCTSLLQPVIDHSQDLPPPLHQQVQDYASPYTAIKPSKNNTIPSSIIENIVDASPQLFDSSGNEKSFNQSFDYDNSTSAPPDQAHEVPRMDSYLGV